VDEIAEQVEDIFSNPHNEKNPNIRDSLENLMQKIIIAQYQQNDK